jgi:hypothetical protein
MSVIPSNLPFKQVLFLFGTIRNRGNSKQNIIVTNGNSGRNYLLFGQRNQFPSEISLETDNIFAVSLNIGLSNFDDAAVRSIDYSGDINRDQHRDLVVGDPVNSQVYVLFGNRIATTTALGMKYGFIIFGEKPGSDSFGWAVSSQFDFNNDGYDDIIIGAILLNRCYIIFGKSSTESVYTNTLTTATLPQQGIKMIGNTRTARNTGMSVSSAGDFNGDGFHDVVFSAATTNSANIIYIVYGSRNPPNEFSLDYLTPSQGIRIYGTPLSYAGISISWLGDVSGDRIDDIIIGSLPFSNGYTTQISYLLYGNRNQTLLNNLQLQSIPEPIGSTIVGGGIVVAGPADVNHDGLNDILITSYENWQGKSGVFMLQYPVEYTSKPSKQPTSVPTGFWTNFPSLTPTETPTIIPSVRPSVPTAPPTAVPSGPTLIPTAVPSNPTSRPSNAPITPTVVPTVMLSKNPALSPTRAPKMGKPILTLFPTRSPTVLPSLAPSIRPTRKPTVKPTPIPSTRTPSQFPTSHPSLLQINDDDDDNSFVVITVTEKGDTVSNSSSPIAAVKVAYLINMNNDSTITGAGKVNKYIIQPNENVRVTITNFNLRHDVIDVSRFPQIKNITDIMYVINPFLTIILPNNEQIILESYSEFVLTERNFIFAPEESTDNSSTVFSRDVVLTLGFAGFVLIGTFLYFQFSGRDSEGKTQKNLYHRKIHNQHLFAHSSNQTVSTNKVFPLPQIPETIEEDGDIEMGHSVLADYSTSVRDGNGKLVNLEQPFRNGPKLGEHSDSSSGTSSTGSRILGIGLDDDQELSSLSPEREFFSAYELSGNVLQRGSPSSSHASTHKSQISKQIGTDLIAKMSYNDSIDNADNEIISQKSSLENDQSFIRSRSTSSGTSDLSCPSGFDNDADEERDSSFSMRELSSCSSDDDPDSSILSMSLEESANLT